DKRAGNVGIRSVSNQLYLRLIEMLEVFAKILWKNNSKFDFTFPEILFDIIVCKYILSNIKIGAFIEFTDQGNRSGIFCGIQDSHFRILHFISKSESKNDDLYNWHAHQDEHRSPVTQDVMEFFS